LVESSLLRLDWKSRVVVVFWPHGRSIPLIYYIWPTKLTIPPRPPKLVYLDLNHWVSLAKAQANHPLGHAFKEVLAACDQAASRGSAIFPISDSIYFEVSKIGTYRQRRDLREVIERISGFMVVTSRSVVSAHEIETMLDSRIGPSSHPINAMNYIDWGVMRAFGMVGAMVVRDRESGADVTAEVRAKHPGGSEEFDRIMWEGQLGLNRSVLDGPTPDEEPRMRATGWNPRAAFEVAERRAQQEIEQVARFNADPAWRHGRIRDVIAAREVIIEVNEHLWKGLQDRGVEIEDAFPDPRETALAWNSMPSFDVAVTLKTEYHRDPGHVWRPNDITDIDALGSTLPYCDIVVTDKEVASHARRTGLADRLGTSVLSNLADLPPLL